MQGVSETAPGVVSVLGGQTAGVRLLVESEGHEPRAVFVTAGHRLRLGRGVDQDVVLADSEVSREHAEFRFDGQRAVLEDLGSRNGTWLAGHRVTGVVPIATGDVVKLGAAVVVVALITTDRDARADDPRPRLFPDEVAEDPASLVVFRLLARLAPTDLPVLLQGETGTGKEVAARALHRRSKRSGGPFVAINCAALHEGLADSDLFGHERGSFTGAVSRRLGAFETARGGTLLLDEVGELTPASQARLLRTLEERQIVRMGSSTPIPVDVRVVTASNRDLLAEVAAGRFRSDLYFRLAGATVHVPPLRARRGDLVALVDRMLTDGGRRVRVGPEVRAALAAYGWPGNVRELRNVIERAVALCDGCELTVDDLPPAVLGELPAAPPPPGSPLRDHVDATERAAIVAALGLTGGNQSQAARDLGITRRALLYRMERHGLKPRGGGSIGG